MQHQGRMTRRAGLPYHHRASRDGGNVRYGITRLGAVSAHDARRPAFVAGTAIWIPMVVIGLLFLPMALIRRSFGPDWTLHLWSVRRQQWNIEATGHRGLFLSANPFGAFHPIFAFVGSGVCAVGGYLAIALGNRLLVAYKLL